MNENDLSYSKLPFKIDTNIQDKNFHDLENLKQIDKFSILKDILCRLIIPTDPFTLDCLGVL